MASHTGLSRDAAAPAAAAASDSKDEEQEEDDDVEVAPDVDSSLSLMVPFAAADQELPMGDSRQLFRADL